MRGRYLQDPELIPSRPGFSRGDSDIRLLKKSIRKVGFPTQF